jgi:hypothetical protein
MAFGLGGVDECPTDNGVGTGSFVVRNGKGSRAVRGGPGLPSQACFYRV